MVAGVDRGWLCSHEATCIARTRLRARRDAKAATNADRSLPFLAKPVAVIARDPEALSLVQQVLTEFAGLDVDPLDGSPRSLAYLMQREYDCVVVDAVRTDPVGFTSDLTRRVASLRARGVPVVICRTPGEAGPAHETLVERSRAVVVERPFDVPTLIAAVAAATGAAPAERVAFESGTDPSSESVVA